MPIAARITLVLPAPGAPSTSTCSPGAICKDATRAIGEAAPTAPTASESINSPPSSARALDNPSLAAALRAMAASNSVSRWITAAASARVA